MSENIPSLPGALPPKPAESKVQPKKETVRINLPPKPTASPTIKLPTLPAGGPPPSAATAAPSAAAPHAALGMPKPPSAPPTSAAPVSRVAGGSPNRPSAPASASPAARPALAAAIPTVSKLDKALAVSAAVISLAALGSVIYLAFAVVQPNF